MEIRFLLAPMCAVALLYGQGERGSMSGTVTDSSGAAVPGATVTATEVATNVETKATTTETGVYRIPYLPAGTYRVTVTAPGFKAATVENAMVRVAQAVNIDFKLELGQISEQVTVAAEAPMLESSNAELSRYVSTAEFDNWPVPVSDGHRQLQSFIFRSLPGAVGNEFEGSINGGQYYSHEILIEGIPLGRMDLQGGSNNEFSPSAEAVSEFKLQAGTMSAQYNGGQTSVANFAIKSGTNSVHGSAFTYVQNDALRANSAANNALGIPRSASPYKLLNYGGSLGGPVYLPKIYNGKNRTFFFFNYEATRTRDFTSTSLTTLPQVAFKRGDFSQLLNPAFTGRPNSGSQIGTDALGRPVIAGQIYDPASTRSVNGQVVRDPFPGNIIPQNRWDPVARNILNIGITDPINGNMLRNYPAIGTCCPVFDERIIGIKGDHVFNERHRLSAYYNHHFRQRNNSPGGRWGVPPGLPTGVYQLQYTPGRLVRIAEDWTISPRILNHFAIGYNRFGNLNQSVHIDEGWPAKIGLQNVDQTTFPALIFTGQNYLGGGIGAGGRLGSTNAGGSYNGSTIVQDDLTIIHGSHSFRMGFEQRNYYYNTRNRSSSGSFTFSPVQTQLPGFASDTGHAFASFILGAVSATSRSINPVNFGHRSHTPGFYFQDDWKVTRKFTLNLGLRWEFPGPLYEVAGRMSGLDPNKPNPGAGGRPGALVFVEDMGRNSFQSRYWKQISPRFGFAYQTKSWMVVRGGYGINNTPLISNGFGFPGTFGYNGTISLNSSNTPLQFPQDPVFYLSQRYPDFQGTLPNKNPALANGQGITYIAPDSNRLPYVQNWNLGFQFQLPSRTVFEAAYVGSKGTRLLAPGMDSLNQLPVSMLRYGDALIDQASAHPEITPLPYPGFVGTVAQALRPFPQYTSVGQKWPNFGTSMYNSMQLTLTRHFANDFGILAAYTWSKAIDLMDDPGPDAFQTAQDVYNRALERSVTGFNFPHVFKLTWLYDLPIGPGKLLDLGGVGNAIIGGWRLTGIHNYRSGSPLAISVSGINNPTGGAIRPDLVPGVPIVIDKGQPVNYGQPGAVYLNPAAFRPVPTTPQNIALRLGTAPRYLPNVRGPAFFSEDFGLEKRFVVREKVTFEIRGDAFNVFNRAGRGNPDTDIASPTFGMITGFQQGPRSVQLSARMEF
ncbi:MAG TPA: carboxypeptidase regulatory-like domain-containing protein [Bryobacteraceae bacterium]|nr:carboxypeptidase regulatory-like domain-containing protein [Bryobacteraceae bacterium]